MKTYLTALVLTLAIGCKKKAADNEAAGAPKGPVPATEPATGGTGSAGTAPTPAPVGSADTTAAGSAAPAGDTAGSTIPTATGSAVGPTGDASDCGTYAALVMKCSKMPGDVKGLEMSCKATIAKNNAMTSSMKAQVACATASGGDCDKYGKCMTLGH